MKVKIFLIFIIIAGALLWSLSRGGQTDEANQQTLPAEQQRLLALDESDEKYVQLASYLRNNERYEESEQMSLKAIELNSENKIAHLQLGNYYTTRSRYEEAEYHIKSAMDLDPSDDWPYLQLGNLYNKMGRYEDAETYYTKAIEHNPQRMWGYKELGKLLMLDNARLDEAEEIFRRAIEIQSVRVDSPTDDPPYDELEGLLRQQGKDKEADDIHSLGKNAPTATPQPAE